jgi:hypothetical protein
MANFWQGFLPYQVWRFIVLNTRMYMIARGIVGHHD